MGVPVCRSVSTILAIWSVFHTKMALDTKRVFEKLTLPLRSRAHLRDYGSHEHPMLRHRSQRRAAIRLISNGSPRGKTSQTPSKGRIPPINGSTRCPLSVELSSRDRSLAFH